MRRLLPRRPRSIRSAILRTVLVLVVVVVAWTVITALLARSRLNSARAELTQLQGAPPSDLHQLSADVVRAQQLAASAAGLTGQPGPWLFAHVPVLGRSIAAEHTIAAAASGLLAAVHPVIDDAGHLGTGGHGVDLAALSQLQRHLAAAPATNQGQLAALDRLRFGWTPSFVSNQGKQAVAQLRSAIVGLGTAARAVQAMEGVLGADGQRNVMVVLENNAELRGTGGLLSSYALGTTDNGKLQLGKFTDINTIAAQPYDARQVPAPAGYTSAYGRFLANTTLWRNANMSADVPQSAAVMARLMEVSRHVQPDVVIFVDVPAMAQIIGATGQQVQLPDGEQVSGPALTRALLLQSYGKATENPAVEAERKAQLDTAAGAVFAKVSSQSPGLSLVKALAGAAGGRHIAVWSDRPQEESSLIAAGAGGAVDTGSADIAMVTGQNLGDHPGVGNKLDYYVSRTLQLHATLSQTRAAVTETLTLANHVPSGLGPYIAGPRHPGQLSELVGLSMPAGATIESFTSEGRAVPEEQVAADNTHEVRTIVTLPPGQSRSWTLTYTAPITADHFRLIGLPQPLATPATLDVRLTPAAGLQLVGNGSTVTRGGSYSRSGQWSGVVTIDVNVAKPSWWQQVRQDLRSFWDHKVRL